MPVSKLQGYDLARIAGMDRWATAQLVGLRAQSIAGGSPASTTGTPSAGLTVPADVRSPDVFLNGAQQWIASDCSGATPIVVASDAAAQSDIYSAITLAGAIGTHCVILAGPRDGDIPGSQLVRLEAAAAGGYVVGGKSALPAAKLGGRVATRIAGADRWTTAQLVGRYARGDAGVGTSTAESSDDSLTSDDGANRANGIAAGEHHSCALRLNGTIACWGHNGYGQADAPPGTYQAVTAGNWHSCALRADDTITCWGWNGNGQTDAPPGEFVAVIAGSWHSCALSADDSISCWGSNGHGQTEAPQDTYKAVTAGNGFSCGLHSDDTVTCWGLNDHGQADAPKGAYTTVAAGGGHVSGGHSCGLRIDGSVTCWGWNDHGQTDAPQDTYKAVTAGAHHTCALRSDDTVTCWGLNEHGQTDAPEGAFTAIAAGEDHSCALRANKGITCWGRNSRDQTDARALGFIDVIGSGRYGCAIALDRTITCWALFASGTVQRYDPPVIGELTALTGNALNGCAQRANGNLVCWSHPLSGAGMFEIEDPPPVKDNDVDWDTSAGYGCAVRADLSLDCWAGGTSVDSPISGEFIAVIGNPISGCARRTDLNVVCWGTVDFELRFAEGAVGDEFIDWGGSGFGICAIRADRALNCWRPEYPTGVDGVLATRAPPVMGSFSAVDGGADSGCAIRTDRSLICWIYQSESQTVEIVEPPV